MPTIIDPVLRVEPVADEPGKRRLRVAYQLRLAENDVAAGADTVERAVVRSRDLHDAPVAPEPLAVKMEHRGQVNGPGTYQRDLTTVVGRVELDVERDWWRTDHGGGIEPIAELSDHLMADITVSIAGQVVAEATTPVVTGSWGALGDD